MRGNIANLIDTLPQQGSLEIILLRPERKVPMQSVEHAWVKVGEGLVGDRFRGRKDSKRQITLFQAENLEVLVSFLGRDVQGTQGSIAPRLLRRNLIVSGINLHALRGKSFRVGDVLLEGASQCHPCSRMETALGPGGFNAMRGIGGLCAKVLSGGEIKRGDKVYIDSVAAKLELF